MDQSNIASMSKYTFCRVRLMHPRLTSPKLTSLLQKAPFSFLAFVMFRNISNQILLKDSLKRIQWLRSTVIVLICMEVQVKFRFVCLINKVIKMYVLCTSLGPDILRPMSPQRRAKAGKVKIRHLENLELESNLDINWSLSPWDLLHLNTAWIMQNNYEKCTRWPKVCRNQNISPICTCWTFTFNTMSIIISFHSSRKVFQ